MLYNIRGGDITNITKFFTLAENASRFSDYSTAVSRRTGCVLVCKNRVISVGWNTDKEHPSQKKYNAQRGFCTDESKNSMHAEIYALVRCHGMDIDWSRASIFVYRRYANGSLALAKPCNACMKALLGKGIRAEKIYYTGNGCLCKFGD